MGGCRDFALKEKGLTWNVSGWLGRRGEQVLAFAF